MQLPVLRTRCFSARATDWPQAPTLLLTLLTTLLFLAESPAAEEWKGTQVIKDDVLHVMNPAEPMEAPVDYDLVEMWRISGETEDGPVFGSVSDVEVDSHGNIYLLDGQMQCVLVLSQRGEILRRLGRQGEGPGEFQFPVDLMIADDRLVGVVDAQRAEIILLQHDGTPHGTWQPQWDSPSRLEPLIAAQTPRGIVLSYKVREQTADEMNYRYVLGLFHRDQRPVHQMLERVSTRRLGEPLEFDEEESESFTVFAVDDAGMTYAAPRFSEYTVDVFDVDGYLQMVIGRAYAHLPRTKQRKNAVRAVWEAYFSQWRGTKVTVEDIERDIQAINVRTDGHLWIETSRGWFANDPGIALTLDEYDDEGHFVRQVVLRGQIDPAEDYLFILGSSALRVTYGLGSLSGWLGSDTEVEPAAPAVDVPSLVFYELVMSDQ